MRPRVLTGEAPSTTCAQPRSNAAPDQRQRGWPTPAQAAAGNSAYLRKRNLATLRQSSGRTSVCAAALAFPSRRQELAVKLPDTTKRDEPWLPAQAAPCKVASRAQGGQAPS